MTDNSSKPAMPISVAVGMDGQMYDSETQGAPGLTKREHFAAMALQGIVSDPGCPADEVRAGRMAVRYAEGLLAALEE